MTVESSPAVAVIPIDTYALIEWDNLFDMEKESVEGDEPATRRR